MGFALEIAQPSPSNFGGFQLKTYLAAGWLADLTACLLTVLVLAVLDTVALLAGLPERVAGLTIDRQCAGGLDAILLAQAMVDSGAAEVVLAGGAESYSRRPLRAMPGADGVAVPYDQAPFTPWPDRDPEMGAAAASLAAWVSKSMIHPGRAASNASANSRDQSVATARLASKWNWVA